jgi:hypothetical protein
LLALLTPAHSFNALVRLLPEQRDWRRFAHLNHRHRTPDEGRSWRRFHHHLALSAVAYLFILVVHLRAKKNFWCDVGSGVESDSSVVGEIDRLLLLLRQ